LSAYLRQACALFWRKIQRRSWALLVIMETRIYSSLS